MNEKQNGLGTTSIVLGIISAVFAFIPFTGFFVYPCAILAVIFGGIGISKSKILGGKGKSITGLVLGVASLGIKILYLVVFAGAVVATAATV